MASVRTPRRPRLADLETSGFATASKAESVRIALSEGLEALDEIHDFILAKFGHDIPKPSISSYKAQEKARQAKKAAGPVAKAKQGRKSKAVAPIVNGHVVPPEKLKTPGEADVLLALESVKGLVGQFGADKVKRMIDLIG